MEEELKEKIAILEKRIIALEAMDGLLTQCMLKNSESIKTLSEVITRNAESIINITEQK